LRKKKRQEKVCGTIAGPQSLTKLFLRLQGEHSDKVKGVGNGKKKEFVDVKNRKLVFR